MLNQAGQSTVALFFMITGFLFASKALKPINWNDFYRGRIARLVPLYFALVTIVVVIVLSESQGTLHESIGLFARHVAMWLAFVCFGVPDINAYERTWIIIAGVNWSLKYEVIFYVFAVPILFQLNRRLTSRLAFCIVALTLIGLLLAYRETARLRGDLLFSMHFAAGIAVAYAYHFTKLRGWLES